MNVKISYKWVKSFFKKNIFGFFPSPNKVAQLLTDKSFEVEEVEKVSKDHPLFFILRYYQTDQMIVLGILV